MQDVYYVMSKYLEDMLKWLNINKDEYLIINEDGRADKLMITKKGIQKDRRFLSNRN